MSKEKLTFGPPGDEWTYDKRTKTYDLTRGASSSSSSSSFSPPLNIALTQGGVPGATVLVDPSRTALVVVDMQNFFLHPSCRAHPAGLAAVAPLRETIAAARAAGVRVVWLNWGLTDADLDGMPAGVAHGFARRLVTQEEGEGEEDRSVGLGADLGGGRGRCLVAGSWNAEIYGPLVVAGGAAREEIVVAGDVYCAKNRMSGLWTESQPLWQYLSLEEEVEEGGRDESRSEKKKKKMKKTTTLLFSGVNTDQCVLGTLADAYNAGWDCILVEDCCATTTEGASEVCLSNVSVSGLVCDMIVMSLAFLCRP